jgi:hypothetical protein
MNTWLFLHYFTDKLAVSHFYYFAFLLTFNFALGLKLLHQ